MNTRILFDFIHHHPVEDFITYLLSYDSLDNLRHALSSISEDNSIDAASSSNTKTKSVLFAVIEQWLVAMQAGENTKLQQLSLAVCVLIACGAGDPEALMLPYKQLRPEERTELNSTIGRYIGTPKLNIRGQPIVLDQESNKEALFFAAKEMWERLADDPIKRDVYFNLIFKQLVWPKRDAKSSWWTTLRKLIEDSKDQHGNAYVFPRVVISRRSSASNISMFPRQRTMDEADSSLNHANKNRLRRKSDGDSPPKAPSDKRNWLMRRFSRR